jgi:hypothetical protein
MTAVLQQDTPPARAADRSARSDHAAGRDWIARLGPTVDFLLAAELTVADAVERAAEAPDAASRDLLATARRRMLDAAAIVAAADPLSDLAAAELLRSALAGVRELADRATDSAVGQASVARRILAVEADLANLIWRLRHLGG